MFGPGAYVPDPTEGIVDSQDLPRPHLVAYSRNHDHTPCPRCDHLAYRHTSGQRTLHDLGDLVVFQKWRWPLLHCPSKGIAVHKQANDKIVHLCSFREADGLADQHT